MIRIVTIILNMLVLSGCATHATLTGKAYPEVDPINVKILFKQRPSCNHEELGFITTPLKWNQNVAVQSAREAAAEIGADYVVIETVHRNQYNDTSVSAVAYKCGKVDRERIEISN